MHSAMKWSIVPVILLVFTVPAIAQDGAKALFYTGDGAAVMAKPQRAVARAAPATTPARSPGVAKPAYLGIKYWVELIGKDGARTEVAPDRVFRSGERIKLRVETNRDGYLYLVNVGTSGAYHLLFPHPKVAEGSNFVKARTIYDVPYGAFVRFDDNPGEETLLVILSPQPMTDPVPAADARTRKITPEDGRRVVTTAYAHGAKDLTLEVDTAGVEPRAYAVAPLSSLGERGLLVLDIKLRHK